MPYIQPEPTAGKKRRRANDVEEVSAPSRSKPKSQKRETHESKKHDVQAQIDLLESQIKESRQHYNNIASLIALAKEESSVGTTRIAASVALCRVYCRLLAERTLVKGGSTAENETIIIQWLVERFQEYTEVLRGYLAAQDSTKQLKALTLFMQLAKQESAQAKGSGDSWKHGVFSTMLKTLLMHGDEDFISTEFVQKYATVYDDVRYYTLWGISSFFSDSEAAQSETAAANAIAILSELDMIHTSDPDTNNFFGDAPQKSNKGLLTRNGHKKQAQDAWLSVFRSNLSQQQRKNILTIMTARIVPLFTKPELLMDFLTDCYNVGGSFSLLALSGLYSLMMEKNLDYPSFYQKLYSLLDEDLLHSKHRSRFFRLLDEFLSSTHLPAALVASFIKRLSRLALHAPPAGLVVVVPWIYNTFKKHPACTFMMHRETRDASAKEELEEAGMDDPFNMEEADPMETNAIESSIWELETLQSVYHPNVATLAKIVSEQFTKRSYNLEDFLDHSYGGMIDAELSKDLKRAPEVEYEIPRRIFTEGETDMNNLGTLMLRVMGSA